MKNRILLGLVAVVVFQLLVLVVEYARAASPIYTGQEIRLKTVPVDPRSMFRGNYARLRYEIGEVPGADINKVRNPRNGEVVYVRLKANAAGLYEFNGASLEKPTEGLFIRGRIQDNFHNSTRATYRMKYGIEALFAPKQKALDLEKRLRKSAVARIMLASNGKATLVDVVEE